MRNVHERQVAASAERLGALLETLATPQDRLWPGAAWAPIVLDRGLAPGSRGGHADIRYTVTAHDPGRRVAFRFDPSSGLDGTHALTVVDLGAGTTLLRHELEGRAHGRMRLLWPLAVRWAHDAVVEDAFDLAEQAVGTGPRVPARWSPWVRLLRAAARAARPRAVRQVPTPPELLDAAALGRVDATDTFTVRLPRGSSRDVADWHRALVAAPAPAWLTGLMTVRDRAARVLRLHPTSGPGAVAPFAPRGAVGGALVLGADDRHLDLRVVLRVVGDDLQCATVVQHHNALGRAYFAVVLPFHRRVVPALLRRLVRSAPAPRSAPGSAPASSPLRSAVG